MMEQVNHRYHSINLFDVRIDVIKRNDLESLITAFIKTKRKGWITYINIHTLDVCQQYEWFKEFNKNALLSYCDGEGVRWGARLSGKTIDERITLSDYIYDLAKLAEKEHFKLYFLGSSQKSINGTVRKLKILFPYLDICGFRDGYFGENEEKAIIDDINSKSPDILIMGMGVPKQEWWIKENYDKLNVNLAWMGGGVFDFVAGTKIRCPDWVGRAGLEWFYRLVQEPNRLWRRYLIGIPKFFIRVIVHRLFQ